MMKLHSAAFEDKGTMPKQYTCQGADLSPPLNWTGVPKQAESLVLICDDPDAPRGWVHWVLYDIPAQVDELSAALPNLEILSNGAYQGVNDFKRLGYGGPCPPTGTHRYYFKLFAVDKRLKLKPGAHKEEIMKAIKGHVLEESTLMGKYHKTI